jgi:hypothetical protein
MAKQIMDPLTLKKRGSLQRTTRQAVRKDRTFSVPCFLDIPVRPYPLSRRHYLAGTSAAPSCTLV